MERQHSGNMKIVRAWFLYMLSLLLVHTTIVVDADFPQTLVARFNASEGGIYMDFFTMAHDRLKSAPGSEYDGSHVRLPGTPKDINVPPIRWVKVELYSGGSLVPKGATFMRVDSLYTLGFLNVNGVLHYSAAFPSFFRDFPSKMPLPFSYLYSDLTNTLPGNSRSLYPKLAAVRIGRAAAELAVETLSTYRGGTANVERVKHAYLTILIMTSEALRIKTIREACTVAWERNGTIRELDAEYMMGWSALSILYRTNDLGKLNKTQRKKVKSLNITTSQGAGNIIDVVHRSKD